MGLWMIQNIAPLFYTVVELSMAAVCIGLGVLLLRKLADKRIPPFWKNALWLLVLVALVVPFRPVRTTAVLPPVEVNFRQQENSLQTEITQEKTELDGAYQVPADLTQQQEELHAKSLIFEVVIPAVWLLGMVVMVGILLVTRQKMFRGMRTPNGCPYDVLLADCKRQFNIPQSVEIVEQSYLKSPALWGLFRPKILLPDYVAEMSEESQKYILLHELSHLKHWDLWKNTLLLALQIVYWFNPLVWVLFRFIRQDMELLNDERVLKTLQKSEETPYAMSLIEVLGHANKLPLAPQMLCMVDNKDNTKRRIQMIQLGEVFKKHKIIIAVGCLAVIGVLSALFLTSQASPLHWAHTLDKEDIEKVELYWMEMGEEDTMYLLDENQRATLCIMLNNLYGEETENVPLSQGISAQYSIYRTDGTVETISFLPLNEKVCFFRLGFNGFMGDQYQMDDWMGLTEGVTAQSAVAQPETPPTATSDPTLFLDRYLDLESQPPLNADIKWQDDFSGRIFSLEDGIDYAPELAVYKKYYYILAGQPDEIPYGENLSYNNASRNNVPDGNGLDIESYTLHSLDTLTPQEVMALDEWKLADLNAYTQTYDLVETAFVTVDVTWTYAQGWEEVGPQLAPGTYSRGFLVGRTETEGHWKLYEIFWMEMTPKTPTPTSAPDPWGITLTATDVTPAGMSLVCTQSGGGEYYTGENYAIETLENGTWTALTATSDNWDDIAWNITPDGESQWELNWSYLYGSLEVGIYRLSKEIYSGKNATNEVTYYAQFEIPAQELVGDPRLLTADELAYFNEDYFNGATGQNLNPANQFLHSSFAHPFDVDMYQLFYLGTGEDYAMSEDGEYDAVAQAYGFDSWAEIPTDVTAFTSSGIFYMLMEYISFPLSDTRRIGMENFVYLEEYDFKFN